MNNLITVDMLRRAVTAVEASLDAHKRGCTKEYILEAGRKCRPNGFVYAAIMRACSKDGSSRRGALTGLLDDYLNDLEAAIYAERKAEFQASEYEETPVNTIKSDCKINAAERAVRAVGAAIQAERAGYDYRSVIIAAQNVVPELKDMNQIVQCVGTRGSNLMALLKLQTQFIKELEALRAFEELTNPANQEGPQVIYVLRYLQPCDCSTYIKCFETLEGAHKWWHINRHSVISGKILKETLN